jgi:NADPH:quinone reductase-like Zn-dependent oxidoreductase
MLQKRDASSPDVLSIPHQVVDFHEVFSLPLDFLTAWVQAKGEPRLRLRPPYREHLSQAFARFFMRVGLPDDISL